MPSRSMRLSPMVGSLSPGASKASQPSTFDDDERLQARDLPRESRAVDDVDDVGHVLVGPLHLLGYAAKRLRPDDDPALRELGDEVEAAAGLLRLRPAH